jgi:formylglycine-generating enzyme required for sulfatase activity
MQAPARPRRDLALALAVMLVAPGCAPATGRAPAGEAQAGGPSDASTGSCGDGACGEDERDATCPVDCLGIEWVALEGGAFEMGSDDGPERERPAHAVKVASFRLMKREATRRDYRACVDAGACTAPRAERGLDLVPPEYCTWGWSDRDDHPINCIDWDQARAFCEWLGARLPTEAEWEFAARGRGRAIRYPWGDQLATCERAVMGVEPAAVGCREERTSAVCSKPLGNTAEGLCDMAGSVIEWVADAPPHEGYAGAPADGSAWVAAGEPPTITKRVARGGSLSSSDPDYLRTTVRFFFEPDQPRYVTGVRCAR